MHSCDPPMRTWEGHPIPAANRPRMPNTRTARRGRLIKQAIALTIALSVAAPAASATDHGVPLPTSTASGATAAELLAAQRDDLMPRLEADTEGAALKQELLEEGAAAVTWSDVDPDEVATIGDLLPVPVDGSRRVSETGGWYLVMDSILSGATTTMRLSLVDGLEGDPSVYRDVLTARASRVGTDYEVTTQVLNGAPQRRDAALLADNSCGQTCATAGLAASAISIVGCAVAGAAFTGPAAPVGALFAGLACGVVATVGVDSFNNNCPRLARACDGQRDSSLLAFTADVTGCSTYNRCAFAARAIDNGRVQFVDGVVIYYINGAYDYGIDYIGAYNPSVYWNLQGGVINDEKVSGSYACNGCPGVRAFECGRVVEFRMRVRWTTGHAQDARFSREKPTRNLAGC